MRTIERAASIYADPIASDLSHKSMDDLNICDLEDYIAESFKEGVEFAQRWIQIDRCTNGYITAHSLSDIERNLHVIMNIATKMMNTQLSNIFLIYLIWTNRLLIGDQ